MRQLRLETTKVITNNDPGGNALSILQYLKKYSVSNIDQILETLYTSYLDKLYNVTQIPLSNVP